MKNVIDMNPYLPNPTCACRKSRRSFFSLSDLIEGIVTLAVAAGIFLFLVAFFAAV